MLALLTTPAHAVGVDPEALDNPELEAKARVIMAGIRCLVCQNQSIEDSDADLAKDLRALVREQVAAGKNKNEIEAFLVDRYGKWVLLDPPVDPVTAPLYLAPFALLLIAGLGLYAVQRQRAQRQAEATLDADEEARVERLLKGEER